MPEIISNVCFGGSKGNRLFMTGSQSLYALYVETRGAHLAGRVQPPTIASSISAARRQAG